MENKIEEQILFYKQQGDIEVSKNNFLEAENNYKKVLELNNQHYDTLIGLGFTLFQQEKFEEAKFFLKKALEINDENYDLYYLLGKIYKINNNLDDAIKCFTWAIDIEKTFQLAYVELFDVLFMKKKFSEIELLIEQTIKVFGESSDFYHQMGIYYARLNSFINAKKYFELSIGLNKDYVEGWNSLGILLLENGIKEESVMALREVKRINPNHPILHLLYSLEGNTVDSASKEYVEELFNDFAESFNNNLLNELNYSAPEDLLLLLKENTDLIEIKKDVLDLGCGTGIFGSKIKQYSKNLIGVDLSGKMLEKAKDLNVYSNLIKSDINEFLEKEISTYDLIASTDVFIYVGRLDNVFNHSKRLLSKNGVLAFSLESLEHVNHSSQDDFKLTETGRYVHSLNYINRLAEANGLVNIKTTTSTIRIEKGIPVIGYLCLLQKQ